MAEAIVILGQVRSVVQVLQEFADLVGRYQGLPEQINTMNNYLTACALTFEVWQDKWGVEAYQPVIYYEELWTAPGWAQIRNQLGSIKIAMQRLERKMYTLVNSAVRYSGDGRRLVYDGSFDADVAQRAMRRIARSMPAGRRFMWAVMRTADDMDGDLKQLTTNLTTLETLADGFLHRKMPALHRQNPRAIRNEAQRAIEDRVRKDVQRIVKYVREDASDLHEVYRADGRWRCHLALEPAGYSEDFRLLLTNDEVTEEIVVSPVTFVCTIDGRSLEKYPITLDNAVKDVVRRTSSSYRSKLLLPATRRGPKAYGFTLERTQTPTLTRLSRNHTVEDLVVKAREPGSSTQLTYRDKVLVAAALVEGCFRFLGTPWLNTLDTGNVRGAKDVSNQWTAMLSCSDHARSIINTALQDFAAQPALRNRRLYQHQQIYRLGIVLAEIALESFVTRASMTAVQGSGPGVYLKLAELNASETLSAYQIAAEVEAATSETYGNIVRFCLLVLQDSDRIAQTEYERDCETELLYPAKHMRNLLEENAAQMGQIT